MENKNTKTITINQIKNFDYIISDEDLKQAEKLSKWFAISSRFNMILRENEELLQRIDKVIQIIQNDTTLNEQRQRDRMINILRGEDNE